MKSSKFVTFSVLIILMALCISMLIKNKENFTSSSSTTTGPTQSSSSTTTGPTQSSTSTTTGPTQSSTSTTTGPTQSSTSTTTGPTQSTSTTTGPTQSSTSTTGGTTAAGTTAAGTTAAGTTAAGTTAAGTTAVGTTAAGTTAAGTTASGTTAAGTTAAGTTAAGTTASGTTAAGTTAAGTTAAGTTVAGTTAAQTTAANTTSVSLPTTTTNNTPRESLKIICSGLPIDGESTYSRPLCGVAEENTSPVCRINHAYKYCVDVDSNNPPCHMFNGEDISRCPDNCELHVVGGNKAVCREPNSGDLSCSEYNYLGSGECPVGADDPCQLSNDLCVSKPGLVGCDDHQSYQECVTDENCYIKPERGGFKCKTVPENESNNNWEEYIQSRGGNNNASNNNGDSDSVNSNLEFTNMLLTNTRDNKNRNIAVHSLIKNYYRQLRKVTDDLENDLPY